MNTSEFSSEFDVLLNSNSILKPFGFTQSPLELDEYEKSILLTEAQEQIVKELYTGSLTGRSFEQSEELRRSLDSLIRTSKITHTDTQHRVDGYSTIFKLPSDVWFITYESVTLDDPGAGCMNGKEIEIVPMTQDEWHRSSRNPFKNPSKRRAIRLDNGYLLVELISKYKLGIYTVKYLAAPKPIILTTLEGVSINGQVDKTECELNSVTHRAILERAVRLALSRVSQAGK